MRALDEADGGSHSTSFLVAQRQTCKQRTPDPDDLYEVGIVAEIMQIFKVPDGTVRVMLEGCRRAARINVVHGRPSLTSGSRSSRC